MKHELIAMLVACTLPLVGMSARADDRDVPISSKTQPASPGGDTALTASEKAQKKAVLLQQLESIKMELDKLDSEPAPEAPPPVAQPPSAEPTDSKPTSLPGVIVTDTKPKVYERPTGQTVTTVDREQFKNSPAPTIGDVLRLTPGVTISQQNGPRDVSISVRGSNARQTFGIRNVQVFEDGFPVTQPDGLARTDLIDPHVYGSTDVFQGPASTLYGNYATGGAIHFHTRPGGDIRGIEVGTDFGSFGYQNEYLTIGDQGEKYQYMLFGSHVAGDGNTAHTGFDTTTENLLATYALTPHDTITVKFINNDLNADLSIRLSLNQFKLNPYQKGCVTLAATGCASVSLFANGFNGTRVSLSPEQAGLGRNDRRTIAGARWEHDFGNDITWRTQFVFDNRDIKQPTNATSAVGTFPSFNVMSDVTSKGRLFGLNTIHYGGLFANYEDNNSSTYNVAPGGTIAPSGKANLGALTQTVYGNHLNVGAHAREEIAFHPQWTGIVGLGGEYTKLSALQTNYTYPTTAVPTTTEIRADRPFFNVAPEAALVYQPDAAWKLHARVATGYGTPQITNLFITPQGMPGNNTQLKPQRNLGYDLGVDWTIDTTLRASLVGFYEFFTNELVTQSPGASLLNFTFNAPRSEHRGVAITADWHPLPVGLPGAFVSLAYLLDDHRYTRYLERLSAGTQSTAFDRSGHHIPGVPPQYVHARLGYDQLFGQWRGLGGFLEADYQDAFYIDNANLVSAPSYTLVNLNLHYDKAFTYKYFTGLHVFFEVRNVFDKTYVASAGNVSDSLNATTGTPNPANVVSAATGSIYAGMPRTFFGGVRLKF